MKDIAILTLKITFFGWIIKGLITFRQYGDAGHERREHVRMHEVSDCRGQRQHERRCEGHAHCGLEVPRSTKKRAQAQEPDQHEVIDQYGADEDDE